MSLIVYRKETRKNLVMGLLPAVVMVGFVLLIAIVWPEFKESAADFEKLMENPLYQAIISEGALDAGIGSFEGFFGMEIIATLDFLFMCLSVFLGANIIAREVDKKTLDITLSYPIPRWSLPLGKFAAINTYILAIPVFVFISISLVAAYYGENINYIALLLALLGRYCIFFSLSALSLLCAAIFLRPKQSYASAGAVVFGSYILMGLGGLVESTKILQNLSLFYYLDATAIWTSGSVPLDEVFIVVGVGLLALVAALAVFQNRELIY